MATLIICPVCETRYEVKAAFPPEGRKVRCSKCGHVWQAQPVTSVPEPAAAAAAPSPQPFTAKPAAAKPKPKPKPTPSSTSPGIGAFPGVTQPAPPPSPCEPSLTDRLSEAGADAEFDASEDLAAHVAEINAEAAAEPPPSPKSGGIFSRLAARRSAPPPPPPPADTAKSDAASGDAARSDAAMSDEGLDPALVAAAMAGIDDQTIPSEKPPRKKPSPVTIGWAALGLLVALILGALIFAHGAVTSVLPGASRLYALFGGGSSGEAAGLAFEGVRYGWTNEGGQTVLEVQGDVVNTSSSPVDVPTVVIALRDESGEEISEWTTEVGEQELAAGEHAPFLRQIPSPPSNVRSVKVRFAKAD
jgi:predicted Zn finger-like uncharacterized protein